MGAEVDILADGALDYPDDVLASLDVVIGSVHSRMGMPPDALTRRIVRAVENPHLDILGHPTGRLLGERPPMEFDMEAVVDAACRTETALEINASPERLDLSDVHVRLARDRGAWFEIGTDAHRAVGVRVAGVRHRHGPARLGRGGAGDQRVAARDAARVSRAVTPAPAHRAARTRGCPGRFSRVRTLAVARDLLGCYLVHDIARRAHRRPDRRGGGVSRGPGPREPRLPPDAPQRGDVGPAGHRVRVLQLWGARVRERGHRGRRARRAPCCCARSSPWRGSR